jgi:hypothetical protein
MRPGFFLILLALLGPLAAGPILVAGPALAQPAREPGVLPLDRILPGVRRDYPGDFYDADGPTPGPDGQPHYHLKWMTPDGRIQWLDTDARTGRVLGAAPGRDAFDGPGPRQSFAPAPVFPTGPGFDARRGQRGEGEFRGGERGPGAFGGERGPGVFGGGERGPAAFGGGTRGEGAFRGGGRGGYGGGRGRRGR